MGHPSNFQHLRGLTASGDTPGIPGMPDSRGRGDPGVQQPDPFRRIMPMRPLRPVLCHCGTPPYSHKAYTVIGVLFIISSGDAFQLSVGIVVARVSGAVGLDRACVLTRRHDSWGASALCSLGGLVQGGGGCADGWPSDRGSLKHPPESDR